MLLLLFTLCGSADYVVEHSGRWFTPSSSTLLICQRPAGPRPCTAEGMAC